MTHYLYYWKMSEVKEYIRRGDTLDYAASAQFDKQGVQTGDMIWIATSLGLNLEIVGSIEVSDLVDRRNAIDILGRTGLYGSDKMTYAINSRRGLNKVIRVDATDLTANLAFVDRKGRPAKSVNVARATDPKDTRFTFGQAFQTMRRLTPESASLLQSRMAS